MEAEERCIFEWQYRKMGSFKKALMEAICLADDDNIELLKLGFPDEVNGFIKYKSETDWWKRVQEKAVALGFIEYIG